MSTTLDRGMVALLRAANLGHWDMVEVLLVCCKALSRSKSGYFDFALEGAITATKRALLEKAGYDVDRRAAESLTTEDLVRYKRRFLRYVPGV